MHTGYSPPGTADNTATTSSGSVTAVQPPTKVLAMASAIDQHNFGGTRPGIRCAVAVPSTARGSTTGNLGHQAPGSDTAMGGIPDRESDAGSKADSVATSTRLRAAAELVRRKKELAKLEVQEMEIEVEMAAARSSRGSQTSSVRRRNLGDLSTDALALTSPEPLQSKMQRLNDST